MLLLLGSEVHLSSNVLHIYFIIVEFIFLLVTVRVA